MLAIGQMQHNAIIRLLEPDTPIPHLNCIRRSRLHRIQQNPMKIPPMDHPVRRTETFDRGLPQIERLPTLPGASQPHFLAGRGANDLLHGRFQPQRNQQPRSVRTELHPGPDLPQLGSLLEQPHLMAPLHQSQSRRQPAKPRARNQHIRHLFPLMLRQRHLQGQRTFAAENPRF